MRRAEGALSATPRPLWRPSNYARTRARGRAPHRAPPPYAASAASCALFASLESRIADLEEKLDEKN